MEPRTAARARRRDREIAVEGPLSIGGVVPDPKAKEAGAPIVSDGPGAVDGVVETEEPAVQRERERAAHGPNREAVGRYARHIARVSSSRSCIHSRGPGMDIRRLPEVIACLPGGSVFTSLAVVR
jgi:hypothetical protein